MHLVYFETRQFGEIFIRFSFTLGKYQTSGWLKFFIYNLQLGVLRSRGVVLEV